MFSTSNFLFLTTFVLFLLSSSMRSLHAISFLLQWEKNRFFSSSYWYWWYHSDKTNEKRERERERKRVMNRWITDGKRWVRKRRRRENWLPNKMGSEKRRERGNSSFGKGEREGKLKERGEGGKIEGERKLGKRDREKRVTKWSKIFIKLLSNFVPAFFKVK